MATATRKHEHHPLSGGRPRTVEIGPAQRLKGRVRRVVRHHLLVGAAHDHHVVVDQGSSLDEREDGPAPTDLRSDPRVGGIITRGYDKRLPAPVANRGCQRACESPAVPGAGERRDVLGNNAAVTPVSQDHRDRGSPAQLRRLGEVRHVEQRTGAGLPGRRGSHSAFSRGQHHAHQQDGDDTFD